MSENYTIDSTGALRGYECAEEPTAKTTQNENIYHGLYSFFGLYGLMIVCIFLILRAEKIRRDYNKKKVNVRTVYSV